MVNHAGIESPLGADSYEDVKEWLAGMGGIELSHLDELMEDLSASSSSLFATQRRCVMDGLDKLWAPSKKEAAGGPSTKGVLSGIAAMILMTVMYTARSARHDVLKGVCFLAKYITIWDTDCDWRLHRLMCYINGTVDDVMMGFIGDHPIDLTAHIF